MKSFIHITLFSLAIGLVSCASATKKDDPTAPSTPAIDSREKFVGDWNGVETSATIGQQPVHIVKISKSASASSEVLIGNFANTQSAARAVVNNTVLTIPYQLINGGYVTGGSGVYSSNNVVNLTYTLIIGSSRDSCSTVYTK